MRPYILIGILTFLYWGCAKDKDPCEIAIEGVHYVLSDTAISYVSNYDDADRIIFKTLAGDEVAFDIIEEDTLVSYQVGFPCETDTFKGQLTKGTAQRLTYSLMNSTVISEPLVISVLEFPELPTQAAQESIVVSLGEYLSPSFDEGDLLFDYNINRNNPQLTYLDSFVIAGKTFYSVYETNYSGYTPHLVIKYTMNEGVVYIKDSKSLEAYIFERKE